MSSHILSMYWPFRVNTDDRYCPGIDHCNAVVAVPFAMNQAGDCQSLQGVAVVNKAFKLWEINQQIRLLALGGHKINGRELTEGGWAGWSLRQLGAPSKQVFAEIWSLNTRQNALATFELLAPELEVACSDYLVVLVVQELQANRALATFRKAIRQKGLMVNVKVQPVADEVWNDNAKCSLRSPWVFALREILLAWPLFKLRGWA